MSTYRVIWEIAIDAESPKDAVLEAKEWMRKENCNWSYTVEDMITGEVVAIDTEELETEE